MKKIILGSGSPRRREILEQLGVKFDVIVSGGRECYTSREPAEIVKELALLKAENTVKKLMEESEKSGKQPQEKQPLEMQLSEKQPSEMQNPENHLILGADTVVVLDGEILGKPADEEAAFRMLRRLQGRGHQVYTGVAILDFDGCGRKTVICHAEETQVFVHAMEEEEIRRYIETKEPMDKAGGYGIQGRFAAYIDRIEGDYYNVVGLPAAYVYRQLKRLGGVNV